MSKLAKSLTVILAVFIFFELSLYFAVNDLNIWLSYGNPDSASAIFMEIIGQLVAPILGCMASIVLVIFHYREKGKVTLPCAIGGFLALIATGYSIFVFSKTEKLWIIISLTLLLLALIALFSYFIFKLEFGRLFQIYCIALTTVVYCIATLAVIGVIKFSWGRVRPRDLETIAQFTRWYLPQGFTGNTAFPSGHTATAALAIVVTMFAPLVKNKLAKIPLYILPSIWIAFMAVNRVVIGAHYASDTLFSIAISMVLFFLSKKYVFRYIERHLDD